MIDFRYHLVSIIAIFLALALGIVVGTTALNGALLDNLKNSIDALSTDKRALEGTVRVLREQIASDSQLAERVAPAAAQGQLEGQRVVIVTAPGTPAAWRDSLTPLLRTAGATVTGEVRLRPDLLDPALNSVVQEAVAAVPARGAVQSDAPAQRAAQLLTAALLEPAVGSGLPTTVADTVLRTFSERDLVDLDPELGRGASLAVVLCGDTLQGTSPPDVQARTESLVQLVAALDAGSSGAVVAAPLPATTEAGPLRALRDDAAARSVSSVDGIDQPQGRLGVVYALREQAAGGVGQYGLGAGTQGPLPALPPP